MIPVRDTIRSQHTAWAMRLIVLANVAMFGVEASQGPHLEAFLYDYGVVPKFWGDVMADASFAEFPRLMSTLVTSQFLHGGLLHLLSNMLYLWIFGDNVEDRLGPLKFLFLYLASGVAAALAQFMAAPHSSLPMIGASGAIAGVLGAYLRYFPHGKVVTLVPLVISWQFIEVPSFLFLGMWFILQWMQGMTTIGQMADVGGVAWWAHVGGFVTGFVLTFVLRRRPQRF